MSAKITLVDDDRNILTSVSMALEAEGYSITTFNDGEAGLKGIQSGNPDLVVLDIKMPRMTGMEVLEKLRETSTVPVIFLTSKDDEIDEVLGLRMGADDYITKPFHNVCCSSASVPCSAGASSIQTTTPIPTPKTKMKHIHTGRYQWMTSAIFARGTAHRLTLL